MIKTFKNKALAAFAQTGVARKLPLQKPADLNRIKLALSALDAAGSAHDLAGAGFKMHALTGPMKGRYAIWLTGNYRLTFAFEGGNAVEVDIEDYH